MTCEFLFGGLVRGRRNVWEGKERREGRRNEEEEEGSQGMRIEKKETADHVYNYLEVELLP